MTEENLWAGVNNMKKKKKAHVHKYSQPSLTCKLGTPTFWQFLSFFFAGPLKFHQVGWSSVHSHFQISPEMFNRVNSGLGLGHSETFRVV